MAGFGPVGSFPVASVPGQSFITTFQARSGALLFRGAPGAPPQTLEFYFYQRPPPNIRSGPWTDVSQQGRSIVHISSYAAASKFIGYTVVMPPQVAQASKFVGYAVISPVQVAQASKFIGYAVIQPAPITFNRYDHMFPLRRPEPRLRDYTYIYTVPPMLVVPQPLPAAFGWVTDSAPGPLRRILFDPPIPPPTVATPMMASAITDMAPGRVRNIPFDFQRPPRAAVSTNNVSVCIVW